MNAFRQHIDDAFSAKRRRGVLRVRRARIGGIARCAYAVVSGCVLLLALGLTTVPAWPGPVTIAGASQNEACPPSGSGAGAVNWGVSQPAAAGAACPDDGNVGDLLANWGRSLNLTGDVSNAKSNTVAEEVAQAVGEVGRQAQPTAAPVVCSRGACGATSTAVVCSRGDCGATSTPLVVCSRGVCGGTSTPVVVCSRGDCSTAAPDETVTTTPEPGVPNVDLGPEWAVVLRWLPDVLAAQQQVHDEMERLGLEPVLVPVNVVLAEIRIESQGVMPDGANQDGAVGLLQVTANTIGADRYDLLRATQDPAYSIYIGVYELALRYLDSGKLPWANVVVGYFSGHYYPKGARDAYSSDYQYQEKFIEYFNLLEGAGLQGAPDAVLRGAGIPGNWLAGQGQPIAGLAYLWGGVDGPLTQEFGPTDFSRYVHPEWYTYSYEYGFAEPGHTGLDVGIPAGTSLYAPSDAVVVCAGTGNSNGEDGCAAFESSTGGESSGRLQLRLPSGDMLIYGHVSRSLVTPDQHVTKGQLIGLSGSQNGDHVHLEYRVPDPTTNAGWRLVDPRLTPLNGLPVKVSPATVTASPSPRQTAEPEPTQEPTATPEPAEPTKTPRPEEPTEEPAPTATDEPTPEPTATPTETAVPTEAPAPTETPVPEGPAEEPTDGTEET